jgi:NhaP-type Na+/H+ or K+/H+ antiporter
MGSRGMYGVIFYCLCVGILRGIFHWRWRNACLMAGPIGIAAVVLALFVWDVLALS